jgi:hypothetical protein
MTLTTRIGGRAAAAPVVSLFPCTGIGRFAAPSRAGTTRVTGLAFRGSFSWRSAIGISLLVL